MNVAIAGGGTGGHLFPGLAVARLLRRHHPDASIFFLGAERGIEARVVEPAGFELVCQPLQPLAGRNPRAAAGALLSVARAALGARRELKSRGCGVLLGLGGYASAAGVLGARLAGLPVVLLEQNRKPGLTNKLLARAAARVCTSFEESADAFPGGRCSWTGNPLREGLDLADGAGPKDGGDTLLVLGGSAGAVSLNRAVTTALASISSRVQLPPILHQAGETGLDETRAAYRAASIEARVVPFIEDMAAAYSGARVAVCRAGATTVAELLATATPSLLLPYPWAADDHQSANAAALEELGAAITVVDDEHAAAATAQHLLGLLSEDDGLDSMVQAARKSARPGAGERVLKVIEEVLAVS